MSAGRNINVRAPASLGSNKVVPALPAVSCACTAGCRPPRGTPCSPWHPLGHPDRRLWHAPEEQVGGA
eukprot:15439970-Alexandrium_andersonii.AAC.1